MTRMDLAARNYLGVPFVHQGRDPRFGIDCVGLLVLAAMDCGLNQLLDHDFTSYARNPAHGELERRLDAALGPKVSELSPGCVVSLQFVGHDRIVSRHVAIVGETGNRLTLIHTYNTPKRVIEHGINPKWQRRVTGIYSTESA